VYVDTQNKNKMKKTIITQERGYIGRVHALPSTLNILKSLPIRYSANKGILHKGNNNNRD
jgi:hypothetical protein